MYLYFKAVCKFLLALALTDLYGRFCFASFPMTSMPASARDIGTDGSGSADRSRGYPADPPFPVSDLIRDYGAYLDL